MTERTNAQLAGDLVFIAEHVGNLEDLRPEWLAEHLRLAAQRLEAREEISKAKEKWGRLLTDSKKIEDAALWAFSADAYCAIKDLRAVLKTVLEQP